MYFGEISDFGDTVHVINEPSLTVSDYTRGLALETQELVDDEFTLTVDQAKYFQFAVDDIEKKHAHLNWTSLATSSGAYALRDSYDSAILTHISDGISTSVYGSDHATNSIDLGFSAGEVTPLAVLSRLARLLDEQNVPDENRWAVADPLFWEVMQDENSKIMGVDFTGDEDSRLRNGRITDGLIRGFRCYKSNNVPNGTVVGVSTTGGIVLAGHMSAVATASQIANTEVLRSQTTFADIVRGLHVYGRKVIREVALAKSFYRVD